ncbi:hypothetical protein M513_13824 [Trichuris suis]|uniref:Uncharacterized protein n=1 Tax=Trichuris suis TaxID=68888 RepID=A0A085LK04_9BILA|nr:hypothetical protein M513_13824 [Trichuris suis]
MRLAIDCMYMSMNSPSQSVGHCNILTSHKMASAGYRKTDGDHFQSIELTGKTTAESLNSSTPSLQPCRVATTTVSQRCGSECESLAPKKPLAKESTDGQILKALWKPSRGAVFLLRLLPSETIRPTFATDAIDSGLDGVENTSESTATTMDKPDRSLARNGDVVGWRVIHHLAPLLDSTGLGRHRHKSEILDGVPS